MRVAFFGGSFDPPHVAHVLAVAYLLSVGRFERVLVVPVYDHVLKHSQTPFATRLELCEAGLGWMPNVEISSIEQRLGAPSYTLRTLQTLKAEHPDWQLQLVVGSDVLFETHKWHAFDEVERLAPLFVLGRVGWPHERAPASILPEVSSSRVRELARRRAEPPVVRELAALVPSAVLELMDAHGLYR